MWVKKRRPYYDDQPDGPFESDQDFVKNNLRAAVSLLKRQLRRQNKNRRTNAERRNTDKTTR